MRPNTHIAMLCQNVGKPKEQEIFEGTVRQVMSQFAQWIVKTSMAKSMRIEIARSRDQLGQQGTHLEFTEEFDAIFEQMGGNDSHEQQAAE